MFTKLLRRKSKTARIFEAQQHELDCLRYLHADNPLMQLHLDRIQTALDITR